jgi:hypothetical protein
VGLRRVVLLVSMAKVYLQSAEGVEYVSFGRQKVSCKECGSMAADGRKVDRRKEC